MYKYYDKHLRQWEILRKKGVTNYFFLYGLMGSTGYFIFTYLLHMVFNDGFETFTTLISSIIFGPLYAGISWVMEKRNTKLLERYGLKRAV